MCHDVPGLEGLIHGAITGTLELETVAGHARACDVGFADVCNAIAVGVARRFENDSMTYADSDAAMNRLFAVMIQDAERQGDGFELAEPAFAIFEAFDAGEWTRIEGEDPVERYTRPLIRQLLSDA